MSNLKYLHDMASCMKAHLTHKMLDDEGVHFFRGYGRGRWPGKSPDLNPTENLGAIVKNRAEEILMNIEGDRNSRGVLIQALETALRSVENDTELFEKLLKSFRHRLDLVKAADGKSIKKY